MKYLLALMALQDPDRFVAELGASGRPEFLCELWTAVGLQYPVGQRAPADGLVHDLGELDGARVVRIVFPPPQARNEAIAMLAVLDPVCRVFLLERTDPRWPAMLAEMALEQRTGWGPTSSDPGAPFLAAVRAALAPGARPIAVTDLRRRPPS